MAQNNIALHLGNRSLAGLALQSLKRGWAVAGGTVIPVPEDEKQDLAPLFRAVGKTLKAGAGDPATLCLARQQAIIRGVLLPSTDPTELASMARFEAERHIPFNAERHCVGFHVMRSKGVEGSEVLLGAVDGPIVDQGLAALNGGGFSPDGITIPAACLVNSLLYQSPESFSKKTQAIVSIGLDSLDLVFLHQGRVVYARSAPLDLRGVLESYVGWSPEGNAPRPDLGRLATAAHMIDCERLEGSAELAPVERWIERTVKEIQHTYDFARREMKCPPLESIALTGEGAGMRNLDRLLGKGGDLRIEILNPVASLPGAEGQKFAFHGLEFVIAFGAAVGRKHEAANGAPAAYQIDLTPPAHYRTLGKKALYRKLAVTAALFVAAAGLSFFTIRNHNQVQAQMLRDYKDFNARIQPQVAQLQAMDIKRRIIKTFVEDPNAALTVFDSIVGAPSIPSRVFLQKVSYVRGGTVLIEGQAIELKDVGAFVTYLDSIGCFGPVQIVRQPPSKLEGKPVYTFSLDCPLKTEPVPGDSAGKSASSSSTADQGEVG